MPTPPHIMTPEQAAEHLRLLDEQRVKLKELNRIKAEELRLTNEVSEATKRRLETQKAIVDTMEKSKQTNAAELYKVQQQVEEIGSEWVMSLQKQQSNTPWQICNVRRCSGVNGSG